MIHESYYWKKELVKLSTKIAKRIQIKRFWSESQFGTFEKEIMIGFYIIRKLIEAKKLTNSKVSTKIGIIRFPNKGMKVHRMNNHKFFEFYDFDKGNTVKVNVIFLCNKIVHSYIFSPRFEKDEANNLILSSVLFCSDEDRNDFLFEINIGCIVEFFKTLGNDYPSSSHMYFNPNKNEWDIDNKNENMEIPQWAEDVIKKHEDNK
jgi:hypothetical protein